MGKKFLRSGLSRVGYIYPDNYMGAGSPDMFTVGSDDGEVIGGYERALVLGYVNTQDGKHKGMAVRLIDLRHIDGSSVYGVVPENEIFLGGDRAEHTDASKTLLAGNIITVSVQGQSGIEYLAKSDVFEADYICSRSKVLEDVRNILREIPVDDIIVGRVCGRGKNWSYKVDVGGGFRVFIHERTLGRHSVHSKNGLTGGLLLLKKSIKDSSSRECEYKTCDYTFETPLNDLLHGAQTRGILTRADGSGQNFAYIPNCGFIYIAGYMNSRGENCPLKLAIGDGQGVIEIEGKPLSIGCIVQIEVVRTREDKLCGYIRGILSGDATSGCTIL